jgi:influenza virus NS1A-binding protein
MSQARCTHSAVSIFESQEIYVFGGFDYVPLDSVERYNVISNEW